MLWTEQQRGTADLMIRMNVHVPYRIGYGQFEKRYDEDFAPMFGGFARGISHSSAPNTFRLNQVQGALANLVQALDRDHAYTKRSAEDEVHEHHWLAKDHLRLR